MRNRAKRSIFSLPIIAIALLAAAGASEAQTTDSIFADGFESGDTSRWSVALGGVDVNATAALGGSNFGLEVPGGTRSGLETREPDRETTVRVQFLLDPNTFELRRNQRIEILRFYAQGRRHHLRLVLRQNAAGDKRLGLMVRGNRGGYDLIGGGPVTPGLDNVVKVLWEAATSRNGNDGSAALFLNGEMEANEPTLANGRLDVRAIQIGLLGGNAGATRGSYYLDDFASFRTLSP